MLNLKTNRLNLKGHQNFWKGKSMENPSEPNLHDFVCVRNVNFHSLYLRKKNNFPREHLAESPHVHPKNLALKNASSKPTLVPRCLRSSVANQTSTAPQWSKDKNHQALIVQKSGYHSPVEVGSLSHSLQGFIHPLGGCLFLFHQQQHWLPSGKLT